MDPLAALENPIKSFGLAVVFWCFADFVRNIATTTERTSSHKHNSIADLDVPPLPILWHYLRQHQQQPRRERNETGTSNGESVLPHWMQMTLFKMGNRKKLLMVLLPSPRMSILSPPLFIRENMCFVASRRGARSQGERR